MRSALVWAAVAMVLCAGTAGVATGEQDDEWSDDCLASPDEITAGQHYSGTTAPGDLDCFDLPADDGEYVLITFHGDVPEDIRVFSWDGEVRFTGPDGGPIGGIDNFVTDHDDMRIEGDEHTYTGANWFSVESGRTAFRAYAGDGGDDDDHAFGVMTPRSGGEYTFSVSRVGAEEAPELPDSVPTPEIEFGDLQVRPETVTAGEDVRVLFSVDNTGEVDGEYAADVRLDGETLETLSGEVPAGSGTTVQVVVSVDDPGRHEVAVGDRTASVEVEPRTSTTAADDGPVDTDPADSGDGDRRTETDRQGGQPGSLTAADREEPPATVASGSGGDGGSVLSSPPVAIGLGVFLFGIGALALSRAVTTLRE